jgi:hypothetical protein
MLESLAAEKLNCTALCRTTDSVLVAFIRALFARMPEFELDEDCSSDEFGFALLLDLFGAFLSTYLYIEWDKCRRSLF